MKIYIDGDALPNILKPILIRFIKKNSIQTYVVSNKAISLGGFSKNIRYVVVNQGADEADNKIVEMIKKLSDLVITADIPLADRVISLNANAIDHRGAIYTQDNIKQYLAIRNLMQDIRDTGEKTRGPKAFTNKDAECFANSLNNIFQKYTKEKSYTI